MAHGSPAAEKLPYGPPGSCPPRYVPTLVCAALTMLPSAFAVVSDRQVGCHLRTTQPGLVIVSVGSRMSYAAMYTAVEVSARSFDVTYTVCRMPAGFSQAAGQETGGTRSSLTCAQPSTPHSAIVVVNR